ncbi:hypothetical protein DFJ73DRAFT_870778 [Zopfochytrium polystomum]|nr:hypothetical protein DFJ73DRAFT_870778 [Zopfochytrium polystomum]
MSRARAGTWRCLRGGHRGLTLTMVVTMVFPARVAAERSPWGWRQRWWRLESMETGVFRVCHLTAATAASCSKR